VSLGALFVVLVLASVGQAIFQYAGTRLRARVTWQPARALDAVGGAVLSVVAVLLVAWMLGVAISGSRIPGISPQVRESRVLVKVNDVMPAQAQQALRSFDDVVGSSFFPRYLEPFAQERIASVPAAQRRVLRDPDIRDAAESVYKVRSSNRCGSGVEGTGFLYAPNKLMTNAHVVAGVTEPIVKVGDRSVSGTVVYYNSDVDIAVIDVPELDGPTIGFDLKGKARQQGATLGFPQDGPFDAQPVRIRGDQRLRSPDIYGDGTVTRHVFSLRGLIRPGNSGGPVVSTGGRVLGVVFAASVSDHNTGYALTAEQVRRAAAIGLDAKKRVSSGNCA
jgi:S1-C subfamily serine protease